MKIIKLKKMFSSTKHRGHVDKCARDLSTQNCKYEDISDNKIDRWMTIMSLLLAY